MGHFFVSDSNHAPHHDRYRCRRKERARTMDGVQSAAEFTDAKCYAMCKIRRKMSKAPFHPLCQHFAASTDDDRSQCKPENQEIGRASCRERVEIEMTE